MIIFGASLSPFVSKAVAFAHEKGLDFEHRPVAPGTDDADFRACSPFGKIPGMKDGDYCLGDSTAIACYLDAKHPDPALIPADPEARGRVMWFDEFADTIFIAKAGPIFFNRVVATLMGQEPDHAVADKAEADDLPGLVEYIEGQLEDDWLVGDSLTLADISVAVPFKNLDLAKAKIDWERFPKTKAHKERVLSRESFAGLKAMDAAFLGGGRS